MRRSSFQTGCLTALAAALACATAFAPAVAQDVRLSASDGAPGDRFGDLMAADGDTAVLVATGAAAAYVFGKDAGGWTEQQKLVPSDGAALFGTAVDIEGDTIVIGAGDRFASATPGTAYVFRRSGGTWSETQILVPSVPQSFDGFGTSVAIEGDTLLVGSPGFDPPWAPPPSPRGARVHPGAIFVFETSGGGPYLEGQILDGTVLPSNSPAVRLGVALALSGNSIVNAGGIMWRYQFARPDASSPFVFEAWVGGSGGRTLVLVGDLLVIGAGRIVPTSGGAVWTAPRNGPGEPFLIDQILSASDAANGDGFGISVALDGDRILAGAPGHDERGPDAGAAYILVRSEPGAPFVEHTRYVPCAGAGGEEYGASVATDGTDVLVGAPGADGERGALYVAADCAGTENQPPVADAGQDQSVTADCAGPGGTTAVLLDGSSSSDPDGDALVFEWTGASIGSIAGAQPLVDLDLGTHVIDLTVDDGNGGTDGDSVTIDVADVTPPELTVPEPLVAECSSTGAGGRGQVSAAEAAVADWLASASATDGCDAAPALAHDAPPLFTAGSTGVTFTATDAGANVASADSSVQVVYGFGGFEPPLMNDNSASIKQSRQGRTIPVKFSLSCGGTPTGGATASIAVFRVIDVATGDTDTTDLTSDSGTANDDGNLFRYDDVDQHYIYNLSTRGFGADATYRIVVTLDGSTVHSVDFSLR